MTIEQWLSYVYYDKWGTHIWNKEADDFNIAYIMYRLTKEETKD